MIPSLLDPNTCADHGKHSADLFLGICHLVAIKLANNDSGFFKKWITGRKAVEDYLIEKKPLLMQIMQYTGSKNWMEKSKDIFDYLVKQTAAGKPLTDAGMLDAHSWSQIPSR
jgi:hypothetical protein